MFQLVTNIGNIRKLEIDKYRNWMGDINHLKQCISLATNSMLMDVHIDGFACSDYARNKIILCHNARQRVMLTLLMNNYGGTSTRRHGSALPH